MGSGGPNGIRPRVADVKGRNKAIKKGAREIERVNDLQDLPETSCAIGPANPSSQRRSEGPQINPDSAVAIHGKREAQSFRSEVDGFVPLTRC